MIDLASKNPSASRPEIVNRLLSGESINKIAQGNLEIARMTTDLVLQEKIKC